MDVFVKLFPILSRGFWFEIISKLKKKKFQRRKFCWRWLQFITIVRGVFNFNLNFQFDFSFNKILKKLKIFIFFFRNIKKKS